MIVLYPQLINLTEEESRMGVLSQWRRSSGLRAAIRWVAAVCVVVAGWNRTIALAQGDSTPEFGLQFLHEQSDDRFQEIALAKVHVELQADIRGGALLFFRPESLPFAYRTGKVELVPASRPTDAKIRVFAARNKLERDLIELKWMFQDVPVRWIVSTNISDVQLPLRSFAEPKETVPSGKKLDQFVSKLLRLSGEIPGLERNFKVDLPWPDSVENGVVFSTNSKTRMTSVIWWFDRWDVLVKDDVVHVLIYSRNPQVPGFDDGSQYFPAEFRKRMLEGRPKMQ
jgi:hypothetical protein